MKRKLAFILVILFLFEAVAEQFFFDGASLVDASTSETLNSKLSSLFDEFGIGVYVVTTNDFLEYGDSIFLASEKAHEQFSMKDDSLLFFIAMKDRSFDLDAHGLNGNRIFTSDRREKIEDAFLPAFRENDWEEGFFAFAKEAEWILKKDRFFGGRSDDDILVILAFCVAVFAISLIVLRVRFSSEKNKLSNVFEQNEAAIYKANELSLLENKDVFTFSSVRTITHQDNSTARQSGSRSGSRGGSSGGHSHRSGHF